MSEQQTQNSAESELDDELECIVNEVLAEWRLNGMELGTICGDLAVEVAKRAVLAEREACAQECEEMPTYIGRKNDRIESSPTDCAAAIRARSNAGANGQQPDAPGDEQGVIRQFR